ncbi:MAG: hypothetical protein VKL20_02490 [Synechocystis sp.]|nr:hypothetical protein [Synechocystis sp.]
MAHHPADPSLHPSPSDLDCLQAEFVPAVEAQPFSDDGSNASPELYVTETTESALATLEPTLQVTDSFEFNYVDRPASPSPDAAAPPENPDILARLFTPWSLGGLFLLVVANGLLTMHSFFRHAAPPPVAISGFSELPPVTSIPPSASIPSSPSLAIDHLSELPLSQTPLSSALNTNPSSSPALPPPPPAISTATAAPLPPPPPTVSLASRLLPPAINPQQAMVPPAPPTSVAPPQGYPTYATARGNAPQPPQPPNPLPTVAVRPVYQPQLTAPLPPPPPPPLSQATAPPVPPSNNLPAPPPTAAPVPNAPNPPTNTAQNVEFQMRQQLPANPGSGNQSASYSGTPGSQTPGTKPYNQSPGIAPAAMSPTQQLVQELERLNQAP